ncbi:MAG: hypothetical protein NTW50_03890 [Candidatus Berkelbacteria bacterium]|nr:hypothetical protein [Candidatus Berkelbacteria bacterium]
MEQELEAKPAPKSFFKRFWFVFVAIILLLGGAWIIMTFVVHPKRGDSGSIVDKIMNSTGSYSKCPDNLSGILTYQLMDPKYIGSMIPLGNVAPPGHTSPVDHIYFNVNSDDQIPLYAPANGWITHIMANSAKATATSDYKFDSYVVTYTICDGLVLDFAGYTDVSQSIQDELAMKKDACKSGITKVGHDSAAEQQCDYADLEIPVTSGELIGHTHREKQANGGYTIPFEIWTANYNLPSPAQTDWSYYDDDRYAHNYCTFDLYSGDLKNQFDTKFGSYNIATIKNSDGTMSDGAPQFTQRTVAPVCGKVDQDVVDTIQGMWFSHKPDQSDKTGSVGATGQGISIIHNNIDPTYGEVSVGGEMNNSYTAVLVFPPAHSGTINREPSEIKVDGQIYCFQDDNKKNLSSMGGSGKVLIQLIDDHHIKAENQAGSCSANESFKTSYNFSR